MTFIEKKLIDKKIICLNEINYLLSKYKDLLLNCKYFQDNSILLEDIEKEILKVEVDFKNELEEFENLKNKGILINE